MKYLEYALTFEMSWVKVMPFLLRRTKDEVLADLPPKIIQDRYCNLSSLQLQLYEDFSHSQAKQEVSSLVQTYGGPDVPEPRAANAPSTHVFQVTFCGWTFSSCIWFRRFFCNVLQPFRRKG